MQFAGRVVVVSPHLDDAIMSLGATIAGAVRSGARVEVLTVFAYKPDSVAPAGPWDAKSGYQTEGEACRSRREEDRQACQAVGAKHHWMSFGAEPYERCGNQLEIWSAVESVTRGADAVLLPGYPLAHPDHAELTELILRRGLNCKVMALYVEQPYLFYQRKTPSKPGIAPALQSLFERSPDWMRMRADRTLRATKFRAVQAYRSQLRPLGLGFIGLRHMLWHEAAQGGEAIAKLPVPLTAAA
jgi:LmbE family N-acetylglucosaminyl deacetylase